MAELAIDRYYLKVGHVVERLSLDESTIYKMIRAGELPSVRIGAKAVRVPAAGLEAYLRRHTVDVETHEEAPVEDDLESLRPLLERRLEDFHRRTGRDAKSFRYIWQHGGLPDTAENADLAIEAFALVSALDRVGLPTAAVPGGSHLTPDELAMQVGIDREEVIRICIEEGVPIYHGRIDRTLFLASLDAVGTAWSTSRS